MAMSRPSSINLGSAQFNRTTQSGARLAEPHLALLEQTVGAPPYQVKINPRTTRSSELVPGSTFPSIQLKDQSRVKQWMRKDVAYEQTLAQRRSEKKEVISRIQQEIEQSQDWLGPQSTHSRLIIRRITDRATERSQGKAGKNRIQLNLSKQQLKAIALVPEQLIPIRLEFEHESYKLRDTFTWNLQESLLTPEIFASHLCDDLRLPTNPFQREIAQQIRRAIEDARVTEAYEAHLGSSLKSLKEENGYWFQARAKRRKLDNVRSELPGDVETGQETETISLCQTEDVLAVKDSILAEVANEELRVLIKLDITLDSMQLLDKFEWDISNPANSPESFAESFAADLGLAGEFCTAIAHSIREQVDVYVKSLCLLGHVTGMIIPDDELQKDFLPILAEPFRFNVTDFTPSLFHLTPEELERNDKERDREVRRKRRTKGRGVNLPDRDHVKTQRTLVPIPSNKSLYPTADANDNLIWPLPELAMPYPIVAPMLPPRAVTIDLLAPISPLKSVVDPAKPIVPRIRKVKETPAERAARGASAAPRNKQGRIGYDGTRTRVSRPRSDATRTKPIRRAPMRVDDSEDDRPSESTTRSSRNAGRSTKADSIVNDSDESSESASDEDEENSDSDSSANDSEPVVSGPRSTRSTRRQGSPDLPFVQIGSPDSDKGLPIAAVSVGSPVISPARTIPNLQPLPWMLVAAAELRSSQRDDRFEIIPRGKATEPTAPPEWRIRCLDCPGKLYNLGPDETLTNFAVHFKNRAHRAAVDLRIAGAS